ncbi:glycoside hydrolase family 18 protein [Stipitochalara longipes BDJ]|nr:glycoside hydrolase family 18 protein [Stipitochalara longipes BDJ]
MKLPSNLSCITCFLVALSAATAASASPAKGTDPTETGFRNVGYFGNWDIYSRNFTIRDIPAENYTHLLYSFAKIDNSTGAVALDDEWADTDKHFPGDLWDDKNNVHGNIKQMFLVKKKQPTLKTMLSIGGWTYSPSFNEILKSEAKRARFASTALKLMYNYGFDGLNLDWEHIMTAEEGIQFVDLLKKMRHLMKEHAASTNSAPFLLSVAVTANPKYYKIMDIPAMDKYLDFWDFMAYDYAGSWDKTSGHQAALFFDSKNPSAAPFITETAMDYYLNDGKIHPSKMNLGLPLYGRAFVNTDGPGKSFEGVGDGSHVDASGDGKGVWDYKDLPFPGAVVTDLSDIGASYSYDVDKKMMVSYDTPNIARQKAKWIKDRGLGGAMWWQVDADKKGDESLVATVIEELGILEKSKNHLNYPQSEYENVKNGMEGDGEEVTTTEEEPEKKESLPQKPEEHQEPSTEVRIIASTSAVTPPPTSSSVPAPSPTQSEVMAGSTPTASEDLPNEEKGNDEDGTEEGDHNEEESHNTANASISGLKKTKNYGKKSASSARLVPSTSQFGLVVAGGVLFFLL